MQVSYERDFNHSYMILEGDGYEPTYEEEMLRQNEVRSLLMFFSVEMNRRMQFWYDISGKKSLEDLLEGGVVLSDLTEIFCGIESACRAAQRFLIAQEHLWISPGSVFVERRSGEYKVYLCYCPMEQRSPAEGILSLAESLIAHTSQVDEQTGELYFKIYEAAASGACDLETIISILSEAVNSREDFGVSGALWDYEGEPEQTASEVDCEGAREQSVPRGSHRDNFYRDESDCRDDISCSKEVPRRDIYGGAEVEAAENFFQNLKQKIMEIFRESLPLKKEEGVSPGGSPFSFITGKTQPTLPEKELLSGEYFYDGVEEEHRTVLLKSPGTYPEVPAQAVTTSGRRDAVYGIGSAPGENDIVIPSDAVSRRHGKLTIRQGEFFLEDLNSTNGTFVNGEPLAYRETRKLSPSDRILFGDVEYTLQDLATFF